MHSFRLAVGDPLIKMLQHVALVAALNSCQFEYLRVLRYLADEGLFVAHTDRMADAENARVEETAAEGVAADTRSPADQRRGQGLGLRWQPSQHVSPGAASPAG